MSLYVDALASRTVRTAIVGGRPLDPILPAGGAAPAPTREHRDDTPPALRLVVPDRIVFRLVGESELERRAAWGDR